MSEPYRMLQELPSLESSVLIVALSGWIDASGAAAAAMDALDEQFSAEPLVEFDDDLFIDYRARRPTMELREGLNTDLVWNVTRLSLGRDPAGRHVLLLAGPEPDMAWRRFATCVGDLAERLGVSLMVGLGAYPFAAPHTRAPRLSCTTPSASVLDRLGFLKSSVDVPAGTEALLEHELHRRGIDAVGLWVQVPHYVSAMAYPGASAALLDGVHELAGLSLDRTGLQHEALIQRQRLDNLVAGNDEHLTMLQQLELAFDATETALEAVVGIDPASLPSGDELAREVEQFLRDQGETGSDRGSDQGEER